MVNKLLQGSDLNYLRTETQKAMPDNLTIQRKTLVSDKQGGFTEGWSDVYQNVQGRVSVTGGSESMAAGRQDVRIDATLTIAYDQSIEQSDKVVHGGETYEIVSVDSGKTWALARRCQMRRL